MAASNPLINSPYANLGHHSDSPYMLPKRSDSVQYESTGPRGLFDSTSRMHEISEEATFIPTSLGEHLLERTYLDDVVRPLVRALVKARMDTEGASEQSQAYADLEKLRRELQRSAQRARYAEQERDDLARRLDLAGNPDVTIRDRADRLADYPPPPGALHAASSRTHPSAGPLLGVKRPRPSEVEPHRVNYEPRSGPPGASGVSVSVAHGEGPNASSVTITTEGAGAPHIVSRPYHGAVGEQASPPMAYTLPPAPRHRPYSDMHSDLHDGEPRHLARIPHPATLIDADYGYADERADRYGVAPGQPPHRPPLSRFSMGGRSPPTSSSYMTSSSDRSLPTSNTFPSTSSASSYSATPYSSVHPMDHEMDELERQRKLARQHGGDHPLGGAGRGGPAGGYMISLSGDANYPVRKLASTKNRTCSSCAAPHDAKFRRGPNGPGTLCDRCGSRWKKFKEQEVAAGKREQFQQQRSSQHGQQREGDGGEAALAASAAAQARLNSASASSQSPMEPVSNNGGGNAGREDSPRVENGQQREARQVSGEPNLIPATSARDKDKEMERERSASVDQLIDD